ncbi:MAG: SDR family oxidoreductase [Bacillota bacterium]
MNNNDLFGLEGKTVIVTGGAGYLGSSISEGLAKYGANVMILSKNKEKCTDLSGKLNQKYGGQCQGYYADIADHKSIDETFKEIVTVNKKIDVLVNNACFGASGTVEEMTEQEWGKGIEGSINGVFKTTKTALQYMLKENRGIMINIASMYGVVSPDPSIYGNSGFNNPPNYGAGKAAIIQFTRYIACHYGRRGIRANSISPGPFPNAEVQQNKEFIENLNKKTALGRIGKPYELQGIVVYLASDSSSYITGQNICIDGGWTAW